MIGFGLSFQSNWNRTSESIQDVEQVVHVLGHIADTPGTLHLCIVALLDTQMQSLVMILLFQMSLNLKIAGKFIMKVKTQKILIPIGFQSLKKTFNHKMLTSEF